MTYYRSACLIIYLLTGGIFLHAQESVQEKPELSADDTIVYDDSSKLLIASGNARLRNGPLLLIAERIEFDRNASIAMASGNAILTVGAFRALADSMTINMSTGDVTAINFRMGFDPVVTEGKKAERRDGIIRAEEVNLFFRENNPWEPSLRVSNFELDPEEGTFAGRGISFRLGDFTLAKLPRLKTKAKDPIFEGRFSVGEDDNLGWHIEVGSLYRISPELQAGGSITGYTKRGVLLAPEAHYLHHYDGGYSKGSLLGGYINDNGDNRGLDVGGQTLDAGRGFADLTHVQRIEENLRIALQLEWRKDSETFRDFRRDLFAERQWTDSHAEINYEGANFTISVFSRLHANDYETVVERRPELSLDLAPTEWLLPELYNSFSVALARLRKAEAGPSIVNDLEADRLDLTYGLRRPFRLTPWLTFTPMTTYRLVDYEQEESNPTRHFGEIGADLRIGFHGDFAVQNETWGIDGVRHDVAMVLNHRHLQNLESDATGSIHPIDSEFLQDPNLNPVDLFDLRQTDTIEERHLFRVGLENRFLTRGTDEVPRSLASLLLYQDLLVVRKAGENTFDDFFADLVLSPADWLSLGLQTKLATRTGKVERTALSTRLVDGDLGELDFTLLDYSDFSEQYQVTGIRRLSERQSLYGGVRYDAEDQRFTHLFLGTRRRIGNSWDLLYSVTRRRGSSKEDDLEFDVSLSVYSF